MDAGRATIKVSGGTIITRWKKILIGALILVVLAFLGSVLSNRDRLLWKKAEQGETGWARCLLALGANPNFHRNGLSTLNNAIQEGHRDMVTLLIDHGADVNLRQPGIFASHPLLHAINHEQEDLALYLISRGAALFNHSSLPGWSPIHSAAEQGLLRLVAAILTDPEALSKQGCHWQSALFNAITTAEYFPQRQQAMVELLLQKGAPPNQEFDGETPLSLALSTGADQVAAILLAKGANANYLDYTRTPLLVKALHRRAGNLAGLLLDHGADPRSANASGETPLQLAAAAGNLAIVRRLLASGANPHSRDQTWRTPLLETRLEALRSLLLENPPDSLWGFPEASQGPCPGPTPAPLGRLAGN